MPFDFSKLNIFKRVNVRSRIFLLLGGVVTVLFVIYFGAKLLSGPDISQSRIAAAPPIQSVPGGTLTPEYQRALMQANKQTAAQAQISGTSAVPTLINFGNQTAPTQAGCIICSDQSANVKNLLDDWVRQGKISPDLAGQLEQLAGQNVPITTYADQLQDLVKSGKLTPDQARALLDEYKKQRGNALLQDSTNQMDPLIQSGQLPLDAASQLLTDQKNGMSPMDYGNELQKLVAEGKITPAVAQQLLGQYTQQRAKEITQQSIAILEQMLRAGQLTPDVEKDLADLENRMVPYDAFHAAVQQYQTAGKIVPAIATKVLDEYIAQKTAIGPGGTLAQLIQQAEADAYKELNDLLSQGKITQDVAQLIANMIQQKVPMAQFQATINQLVQEKKLTPEIAQLKLADYQKITQLRDMANRLANLQANNALPDAYIDELKGDVQNGLITPQQAAELMKQYQAAATPSVATTAPIVSGPGSEAFAQLQQRAAQGAAPTGQPIPTAQEFAAVQTQAAAETDTDRNARIAALVSAMNTQAQQLISTVWAPPQQQVVKVASEQTTTAATTTAGTPAGSVTSATTTGVTGPAVIKAGTILFAVLDTTVNSDYPNNPVLATVVAGPYKGAKFMGKLITQQNPAGQLDRMLLNFTSMTTDEWPSSKSVTAYAIDPDTARTDLASSVNNHYFMRFGAIMATSFVQGFANALTTSNSTSTTGIFGTSTTHPSLGTSSNIWVGLGQVGQTLGNSIQGWVNIPPTVIVNSGVGIGILFMQDVT